MEKNNRTNHSSEQESPGTQLVRIQIVRCGKKKPLTRYESITLMDQLHINYQIGPSGYPLIQRMDINRINPALYDVGTTN